MFIEEIQKNTIALCMIVKNEEKNIERCLKSVEGIVNEIVIVDTGSTDNTKEIAKKYATTFIEEEWNDNFSYMRNLSIQNAKSDWILVLDADEELDETTKENIFDAVKYENVIANFLYIRNIFPSFNMQVLQARLFRNHKGLSYDKPIAENILNSIKEVSQKENLLVKNAPIYINHIGYLEEKDFAEKFVRNAKQLENVLIDFSISNSDRIYYLIKLINTYRHISNDHEKTISLLTHTFNLMKEENYKDTPSESEMLVISTNIVDYLLKIKSFERAEEIISNTLNQYPNSLNMLYLLAVTKMNLNKQYTAIEDLVKCQYLLESDTYYKYEPIMIEILTSNVEKLLSSFPNENGEIEKIRADVFKKNIDKNIIRNDSIKNIYTGAKIDPKDEFPSGPIDISKLITVCVIPKSENDKLDLSLGEIYKDVDEIIVIDLTDDKDEKIVKEAEKYNANVFSYTWEDDFSRLKNYALSYASSQWIIFLETNESFSKKDLEKLLPYLENSKLAGIRTNILEYKDNELVDIKQEYKIFRNIPSIRYVGNVFESINHVLTNYANENDLLLLDDSEINIKHYLYDNEDEIKLQLDLLYKVLASTQNPVDKMFSLLNISKLSKQLGNKQSAFRNLLNAYDETQSIDKNILVQLPFLSDLYLEILGYLDSLGKNDVGKNMALELIRDNSNNYKFFYYAGKFIYNLEFSDKNHLFDPNKNNDKELVKNLFSNSLECIYKNNLYNRHGETVSVLKDKEEMKNVLETIFESDESKSKLSFYAITKNEEKYLEKCLNSIKNFVDEIIIVDTGSSDKTIEIAKSFNAKVFEFVWEDDFSQARNFALKQCSYPWILTLDADEELTETSANAIKILTLNTNVLAYTVRRKDFFDKGEQISQLYRLFQNLPEIKYELPIYESIVKSVKTLVYEKNYKVEASNLLINHYGYIPELENLKHKRNIKLLSKTVEHSNLEDDSKGLLETKLAILYKKYENDLDKSLKSSLKVLDDIKLWSHDKKYENGFIVDLYNNIIEIFKDKNEIDIAVKYALEGLEIYPNSLALICDYSFLLYLKKEYEDCIESFHKCLKLAKKDDFYKLTSSVNGLLSYIPLYGIASSYIAMNNFNIARVFLEQALEVNPNYEPAKKSLELILK